MDEEVKVDIVTTKHIQLIEEQYDAIRELKSRIDGNCICMKNIG